MAIRIAHGIMAQNGKLWPVTNLIFEHTTERALSENPFIDVCTNNAHLYTIARGNSCLEYVHQYCRYTPVKCEVMNKKEVPKSVKETATPPFVLMRVPGRVAKVEHRTAAETGKPEG